MPAPAAPSAINADRTFDGLAAGAHQVALGGIAANCQVQGENPRSVTVAAGATAPTVFESSAPPQPVASP